MIDWQRVVHEMSPIEIAAALTTLVNVWLLMKGNIWTWAWGLVSVILYGIVFYQSRLWSSTGLQVLYYLPMQFYGWWVWKKRGPTHDDDLPVTRLTTQGRLRFLAAIVPLALLLGWGMGFTGAEQSMMDAFVTTLGITGLYLQSHKKIEHWYCWVVVNSVYGFWILPRQGLYVSTLLYWILLWMAVQGWREWVRAAAGQRAGAGQVA
ncbi:MAG: nicotinamide riboside transporter PnuC [Gemmatimonadota bacterium]